MTAAYEQDGALPRSNYRIRNRSQKTEDERIEKGRVKHLSLVVQTDGGSDMRLRDGDFMREARAACPYCGMRALSLAGHPSCAVQAQRGAT